MKKTAQKMIVRNIKRPKIPKQSEGETYKLLDGQQQQRSQISFSTTTTTTTTKTDVESSGNCFPSRVPLYHPNPIQSLDDRLNVSKLIILVVTIACTMLIVTIIVANSLTYYQGVPSISVLIATMPLLSIFFSTFEWAYVISLVLIVTLMSSATYAFTDLKVMSDRIIYSRSKNGDEKEGSSTTDSRLSALTWISRLTIPLYCLYFVFIQLINLVSIIDYYDAHNAIAIIGVGVGISVHILLFIRRILTWSIIFEFNQVEKITNDDRNAFGRPSYHWVMIANFIMILLAISYALGFLLYPGYQVELTTGAAIFEYLLYGQLLMLDYFRVLDLWCSINA